MQITLASNSSIRQKLLRYANLDFKVKVSNFDELACKRDLKERGYSPKDIATKLAARKAKHVARETDGLIIGCDQVLEFEGRLFSKPENQKDLRKQFKQLRGKTHKLLSAAVVYRGTKRTWSHISEVTLEMHDFSDEFLEDYLQRNWDSVQTSVGGYKLEEEGVRLFSRISGDYFAVLGMPLLELLNHLRDCGAIKK